MAQQQKLGFSEHVKNTFVVHAVSCFDMHASLCGVSHSFRLLSYKVYYPSVLLIALYCYRIIW